MPYKSQIIDFMRRKASFLPAEVRSTYFGEADEEAIREWSVEDAEKTCRDIVHYIDTSAITDTNMCPFCVQTRGNCNKCGYFQNHGLCLQDHSDYAKILTHLHGTEKNKHGIMDYVLEKGGDGTLTFLKISLTTLKLKPVG